MAERKSRADLLAAMGHAVESLATQALAHTEGAIRHLMSSDDRVWDHIDEPTKEILEEGLGMTRPEDHNYE